MNSASTLQPDAIWLCLPEYDVVSLKPGLAGHLSEVEGAIERGSTAYRDLSRDDFYEITLDNGRAYIHVRDDVQTVYVVACLTEIGITM
jgi:hypothetical protein